jgi:hypothetical protein
MGVSAAHLQSLALELLNVQSVTAAKTTIVSDGALTLQPSNLLSVAQHRQATANRTWYLDGTHAHIGALVLISQDVNAVAFSEFPLTVRRSDTSALLWEVPEFGWVLFRYAGGGVWDSVASSTATITKDQPLVVDVANANYTFWPQRNSMFVRLVGATAPRVWTLTAGAGSGSAAATPRAVMIYNAANAPPGSAFPISLHQTNGSSSPSIAAIPEGGWAYLAFEAGKSGVGLDWVVVASSTPAAADLLYYQPIAATYSAPGMILDGSHAHATYVAGSGTPESSIWSIAGTFTSGNTMKIRNLSAHPLGITVGVTTITTIGASPGFADLAYYDGAWHAVYSI